jgi:hypothetical protein
LRVNDVIVALDGTPIALFEARRVELLLDRRAVAVRLTIVRGNARTVVEYHTANAAP